MIVGKECNIIRNTHVLSLLLEDIFKGGNNTISGSR